MQFNYSGNGIDFKIDIDDRLINKNLTHKEIALMIRTSLKMICASLHSIEEANFIAEALTIVISGQLTAHKLKDSGLYFGE